MCSFHLHDCGKGERTISTAFIQQTCSMRALSKKTDFTDFTESFLCVSTTHEQCIHSDCISSDAGDKYWHNKPAVKYCLGIELVAMDETGC